MASRTGSAPASEERGAVALANIPALDLAVLPDETDHWPYAPGKGWFAKGPRGSEIHFLERVFLMLSFANLRLRKTPTRRLSDTIR